MKYKSILTLLFIVSCYLTAACQIFNMKAIHKNNQVYDVQETDVYIRSTPYDLLIINEGQENNYKVITDTIEDLIFIIPESGKFTLITDLTKEVYILAYYRDNIKYEIIYYKE